MAWHWCETKKVNIILVCINQILPLASACLCGWYCSNLKPELFHERKILVWDWDKGKLRIRFLATVLSAFRSLLSSTLISKCTCQMLGRKVVQGFHFGFLISCSVHFPCYVQHFGFERCLPHFGGRTSGKIGPVFFWCYCFFLRG